MKLNTGWSVYTEGQLADKAELIFTSLTGNAKFPGLAAMVALLPPLIQALRSAMLVTGPAHVPGIAAARVPLEAALDDLAQGVENTPNVTEAEAATSGFDLPHGRTHSGAAPNAPGDVRLLHGENPGDVIVRCTAVTSGGVRTYYVQWTLDPTAGPWTDADPFVNSRVIKLHALPRGKDIWVRVRVLGTNGFSAWSDPATIMAT